MAWSPSRKNLPSNTPGSRDVLIPHLQYVDTELWAQQLAQPAGHTLLGLNGPRQVIALFVRFVGKFQHVSRAVTHAQPTPLAACADEMGFPVRNGELVYVKRSTPEFHVE
jgi:hypothetical protein